MLSFSWNCEVMVPSAASQPADPAVIARAGQPEIQFERVGRLGRLAKCKQAQHNAERGARPFFRPALFLMMVNERRAWGNPPDDPTPWTVPRSPGKVKCNAATLADNSALSVAPSRRQRSFHGRRMRFKVAGSQMEFAMRMIGAASLVAVCGMLAGAPARADTVPPFKGNDTGGIIAYPLAGADRYPQRSRSTIAPRTARW